MAERSASTSPVAETFVVDEDEAGNISILRNEAGSGSPNQRSPLPTSVHANDTAPAQVQGPQITNKPPVATRACLSCRKLKMKCVGSASPPCERCVKTGRECEFLQPGQPPPVQRPRKPRPPKQLTTALDSGQERRVGEGVNGHRFEVIPDRLSGGFRPIQYDSPSWAAVTPDAASGGAKKTRSPLPSISSASGVVTGVNGNHSLARDNTYPPSKRRRTGGHTSEVPDDIEESLSEGDMEQLLELFQERLLRFISVLGPDDFDDIPTMLRERKALIQSICYVTARFLPGGSAIRDKLYRPVSELLLGTSGTHRSTPTQSLALMQALIVLYAYAQAVPTTTEASQPQSRDLLYWHIKTFTEAQAVRLFLHRSIESLRAAIASQERQISTPYCYKMYTYWLWLYTMSQYGSQATRTPPSIRADASIRAASEILNEIGMNTQVSRLVKEVQLCLSWERLGTHQIKRGEWWCQPDPESVNKDLVEESQAALNRLTEAWNLSVPKDSPGIQQASGLANLEFHARFTQFCITTYAIRPIKMSAEGPDGLFPAEKEAIAKCVKSASHLLAWALDLGPVAKDRLRYLGDFGFVRISFCAFFTLQAFRVFGSAFPHNDNYLDIVEDAALLMTELAMDSKHGPAIYGKSILSLLARARDPSQSQANNTANASQESAVSNARSRVGILSDTQAIFGHEPSSFVPDRAWDFASLFPNMLWN